MQAFRSVTTHHHTQGVREQGWAPFEGRLWQQNYYDHVIRTEAELERARGYIVANPARWEYERRG